MQYQKHSIPKKRNNKSIKIILWIIVLLQFASICLLVRLVTFLGESMLVNQKESSSTFKKSSVMMEINGLSQDKIPTGCESVSAVMALNYLGVSITPEEFIDGYLSCGEFYRIGDTVYGPDPRKMFAGNPYSKNSLGCYPKVIINALDQMNREEYAGMNRLGYADISGLSVAEIADTYIAQKVPVLLWCTMNMSPSKPGMQYYLEDGSLYTWKAGEHCMVFCGYDEENYFLCDPLEDGNVMAYAKEIVQNRYEEMGSNAVVLYKK